MSVQGNQGINHPASSGNNPECADTNHQLGGTMINLDRAIKDMVALHDRIRMELSIHPERYKKRQYRRLTVQNDKALSTLMDYQDEIKLLTAISTTAGKY